MKGNSSRLVDRGNIVLRVDACLPASYENYRESGKLSA